MRVNAGRMAPSRKASSSGLAAGAAHGGGQGAPLEPGQDRRLRMHPCSAEVSWWAEADLPALPTLSHRSRRPLTVWVHRAEARFSWAGLLTRELVQQLLEGAAGVVECLAAPWVAKMRWRSSCMRFQILVPSARRYGSTVAASSRTVASSTPSSWAHRSSGAAIGRPWSGSCQVPTRPGIEPMFEVDIGNATYATGWTAGGGLRPRHAGLHGSTVDNPRAVVCRSSGCPAWRSQ